MDHALHGITAAMLSGALLSACEWVEGAPCGGHCGPGTECRQDRCVPAATSEPEATTAVPEKRDRRRRRRRRRAHAGEEKADDFVPVDDSNVPRYDGKRTRVLDMKAGTERLSNRQVTRHMQSLSGRFNQCIATAAEHAEDELGSGTIEFQLNVKSTGKVSGVSVKAPENLRVFGIVPCLRKAVHGSRFPTWDGPAMDVEYSFAVE